MAAWAMFLGMATLVNATMTGALVSLAGNIPDSSFLIILSRYLGNRDLPPGSILHPLEAASRLQRLRKRVLVAAAFIAAAGAAFSVWALVEGGRAVAMLSVTFWLAAVNLAFLSIPLVSWGRRAGRIGGDAVEEAQLKARPGQPERETGESGADTACEEPTQDRDAGLDGG